MDNHIRDCRIHFMGIEGIGVSALAQIARSMGAKVTGCDLRDGAMMGKLRAAGCGCYLGHDPAHVQKKIDLLVYSSAVSESDAEVQAAHALNIQTMRRIQFLARLLAAKEAICVSGCHGKSTTSWMVSNLLLCSGLDPTVAIGANVAPLGGNFHVGTGPHFVSEVDESDGLLVEIAPSVSIITNIDEDHLDVYGGLDQIKSTFRRYVANTREGGCVVACGDDPHMRDILAAWPGRAIRYGFDEGADVRATNVELRPEGCYFDAAYNGTQLKRLYLSLPGRHNILNSLGALGTGWAVGGVTEDNVRESFANTPTCGRRLERKGVVAGIHVFTDYAHHPREVVACLEAARQVWQSQPGRVLAVFQPHRYSRTKHMHQRFATAFDNADELVVTDVYAAGEKHIDGVSGKLIYDAVKKEGKVDVSYVPDTVQLFAKLVSSAKAGDMVIAMGAGDIDKMAVEFLQGFETWNLSVTSPSWLDMRSPSPVTPRFA